MKKFITVIFLSCFLGINGMAQFKISGKEPKAPCTSPGVENLLQAVDTTTGRQVADNYKTWENGEVILVKFMNNAGSPALRAKIMQYAKEWELYGNITFKFVPDTTSRTNIRVRLGSRFDSLGHNSIIGIECNDHPQYLQTLNLDTSDFINYEAYVQEIKARGPFYQYLVKKGTDFNNYTYARLYVDHAGYADPATKWDLNSMRGTTQHEFGHSLGLLHEQSYPGAILWNVDTVYKYYQKYRWGKTKVDNNVLKVSDQFFTNGTTYDPKSIMHYTVHSWQTLDGYSVQESNTISEGDKKILGALYPKNKKISDLAVPKIMISNIAKLEVKTDNVKKGLRIYPSFDLKTTAVLGRVHFVARLTTEDGLRYIPTSNINYSWNRMAATYTKITLLPSSKVGYNKTGKKNLELFFPFSEMPQLNGQKVKVEFTVYLDDVVNNKLNKLVAYSLSEPLSMPMK